MKKVKYDETVLLERSTEPPIRIRFKSMPDGTIRFSCVGRDVNTGEHVVILSELDRVPEAIRLKKSLEKEAGDVS